MICHADEVNVQEPLAEAMQKTRADIIDTKSVVVYTANAFESFLNNYASEKTFRYKGKMAFCKKEMLCQLYYPKNIVGQ